MLSLIRCHGKTLLITHHFNVSSWPTIYPYLLEGGRRFGSGPALWLLLGSSPSLYRIIYSQYTYERAAGASRVESDLDVALRGEARPLNQVSLHFSSTPGHGRVFMIIQLETQHLRSVWRASNFNQSEAKVHQINISVLSWHPLPFLCQRRAASTAAC